jgi:hypothetical protein
MLTEGKAAGGGRGGCVWKSSVEIGCGVHTRAGGRSGCVWRSSVEIVCGDWVWRLSVETGCGG